MPNSSNRLFFPGNRYLIPFLAFLSAFAPVSTDTYLPALPDMAQNLGADNESVGLTISLFIVFFASSMLIWGPLSDRIGRKPTLIAGSIIFAVSSAFIALSSSIYSLIVWRCVEAIGAGASSAMSMTIVKDILRGKTMERVVGWIQTATILAPMLAPVIGSGLLLIVSWRGIFWCLVLFGLVALAGALAIRETRLTAYASSGNIFSVVARIGVVCREPKFRRPLLVFSAMSMPFFSYLGVSAFIYQDEFGVSAQTFGLFFAFNAFVTMFGPLLHNRFFHALNRYKLMAFHMAMVCVFGAAMTIFGANGPWTFAALMTPISFFGAALRPPSTTLLLTSYKGDNGAVAAVITCGALLCGGAAMAIAGLPFWPVPVWGVGVVTFVVSGFCLARWLKIGRVYDN